MSFDIFSRRDREPWPVPRGRVAPLLSPRLLQTGQPGAGGRPARRGTASPAFPQSGKQFLAGSASAVHVEDIVSHKFGNSFGNKRQDIRYYMTSVPKESETILG